MGATFALVNSTNTTARKRLWFANPHCHWCDRLTLFVVEERAKPDQRLAMATVDHIQCAIEAKTKAEYDSPTNKVLACWECNNRRNEEFTKSTRGVPTPYKVRCNWKLSPLALKEEVVTLTPYYHTHY